MKTINTKVAEKTVAELYYRTDFNSFIYPYIYPYIVSYSYLRFTGTKADELKKDLAIYYEKRKTEHKANWELGKKERIKKLEEKILVTVDGWFRKPSRELKEELRREKIRVYKIDGFDESKIYKDFLNKYPHVFMAANDESTYYEMLI